MKPVRSIRVDGDIAYVPLTKGYEAVIELADLSLVSGINWHAILNGNTVYAIGKINVCGEAKAIYLHRLLISPEDGVFVDHIDGDGLNNKRSNLRKASSSQNMWNRKPKKTSSSGLKGVHYMVKAKKWVSKIGHNKKQYYLGIFNTADEAYAAYCEASKILHGGYSRI
jgi:hypothetical protein